MTTFSLRNVSFPHYLGNRVSYHTGDFTAFILTSGRSNSFPNICERAMTWALSNLHSIAFKHIIIIFVVPSRLRTNATDTPNDVIETSILKIIIRGTGIFTSYYAYSSTTFGCIIFIVVIVHDWYIILYIISLPAPPLG